MGLLIRQIAGLTYDEILAVGSTLNFQPGEVRDAAEKAMGEVRPGGPNWKEQPVRQRGRASLGVDQKGYL